MQTWLRILAETGDHWWILAMPAVIILPVMAAHYGHRWATSDVRARSRRAR